MGSGQMGSFLFPGNGESLQRGILLVWIHSRPHIYQELLSAWGELPGMPPTPSAENMSFWCHAFISSLLRLRRVVSGTLTGFVFYGRSECVLQRLRGKSERRLIFLSDWLWQFNEETWCR